MNPTGIISRDVPTAGPMSNPPKPIRVCHPELGWGEIDMLNETEAHVRFRGGTYTCWVEIDAIVAHAWELENVNAFVRWAQRVGAAIR